MVVDAANPTVVIAAPQTKIVLHALLVECVTIVLSEDVGLTVVVSEKLAKVAWQIQALRFHQVSNKC